jgi:hypothetical protein
MPTQEELKSLLNYDEKTGVFTWRKSSGPVKSGSVAGYVNKKGYVLIGIKGRSYRAHRLAWLYCYGEMPHDDIDHINHDKLDNKISNLRVVSNQENHRNVKMSVANKSGYNGVSFCSNRNKWIARISDGKKYLNLGYFVNKMDAVAARKSKEQELGYHPNHGLA